MHRLDSSLSRPKLDTTLILDGKDGNAEGEQQKQHCPLFALVSLNSQTAPSAEIPWSQLLALTLTPEAEPPVLSVGRHKDCNVQLADARVSLHHFEIVARQKRLSPAADAIEAGDLGGGGATGSRCSPSSDSCKPGSFAYECVLNDWSSNGTSINGKTVGKGKSEQLRSGDEICILPAHRVGQENMIAFLFRNATEVFESPKEVRMLDLDELVVCPICMQPIYKCVALMPCFHNFCMACYSEWMTRKDDCPLCRRPVACVVKNHPMEAIVDAFLEANPERRRSPEELKDMEARDCLRLGAGGKIVKDTCTIGTTVVRASVLAGLQLPEGPRTSTATASTGNTVGTTPAADGGTASANSGTMAARGAAATAASIRAGSQVCVTQ